MKYRQLSPTGDYQLGQAGQFLVDSPATVAQAIKTRLGLIAGEWFIDTQEGTPYNAQILGAHTQGTRDLTIKARILDTPGVQELTNYYSSLDAARILVVAATVSTIYGPTQVTLQV